MKKYKIIEQRDGNGDGWYELWVEGKFLWINKWRSVKTRAFRYSYTTRFKTLEEIDRYFKAEKITRTVVEEGITDSGI